MGRPIGPGPGIYLLPSTVGYNKHDATRNRYPQYSFGIKGGLGSGVKSPGPIYDLKRMNERGSPGEPAYSFGLKTGMVKYSGPGPAGYSPEKCPLMRSQRPPVYSFGDKTPLPNRNLGPGPMAYTLKSTNTANAYSMAARLNWQPPVKSPGPASHFPDNLEVYKRGMPKYSMGRRLVSGTGTKTPGPASVGPDLWMPGDASYKFSFGIRHNEWTNPMIVEADKIGCK